MEDLELVESGKLPIHHLFTIRKGEPARDNIRNRICYAGEDIIKIRSRKGVTACLFYNSADHACEAYSFRPLECRVLKCWDNTEIINIYENQRLSRKDILDGSPKLWELVTVHQETCDYENIGQAVKEKDMDTVAYLLSYDRAYRDLVVEKGLLEAAVLDFFFGLPLSVTIKRFGVQ